MYIRKIICLLSQSCTSYSFGSASNHRVRKPSDTRTLQTKNQRGILCTADPGHSLHSQLFNSSSLCTHFSHPFPPVIPQMRTRKALFHSSLTVKWCILGFALLHCLTYYCFFHVFRAGCNGSGDSLRRGKCYIQDYKPTWGLCHYSNPLQ